MSDIHPEVQAALDLARDLRNRIADLQERIEGIRSRRPSPSGSVIAEVDSLSRLSGLYLAPGAIAGQTGVTLAAEIMAAITASSEDAGRQYHAIVNSFGEET